MFKVAWTLALSGSLYFELGLVGWITPMVLMALFLALALTRSVALSLSRSLSLEWSYVPVPDGSHSDLGVMLWKEY